MLQNIAEAGNGIYVRASNSQAGLKKVFEEIGKLDENTFESFNYADYDDRFQYFVALSLLFLVIAFMLNERKSKWADKIKMFNPEARQP